MTNGQRETLEADLMAELEQHLEIGDLARWEVIDLALRLAHPAAVGQLLERLGQKNVAVLRDWAQKLGDIDGELVVSNPDDRRLSPPTEAYRVLREALGPFDEPGHETSTRLETQEERSLVLFKGGLSDTEVAKRLGVTEARAARWRARAQRLGRLR